MWDASRAAVTRAKLSGNRRNPRLGKLAAKTRNRKVVAVEEEEEEEEEELGVVLSPLALVSLLLSLSLSPSASSLSGEVSYEHVDADAEDVKELLDEGEAELSLLDMRGVNEQ